MDPATTEVEPLPEKIEEEKETGPSFKCELYDVEVARKIALALIPGLSTASVDSTTGGIFKTPASVAVDLRKEMIDYLNQRSETFVAESLVSENAPDGGEVSDHPFDIVSEFIDDFATSKRNFFSRVRGWLGSEGREDRIEDFVQEMELNGFWPLERRELAAQTWLKNVDFKEAYHCKMKFSTEEELNQHVPQCGFRTMNCMNDGCTATFIANKSEEHDSTCPFKIIPCEQKCPAELMRREMDRHCITVCPMKLVNCPFFKVGCQSPVPHSMIEQHCSENVHSHMLCILQGIYTEAAMDDLRQRVEQLQELSTSKNLFEAQNVRSLTNAVKVLDKKLGPLEIKTVNKDTEESTEASKTNQDLDEVKTENTENKKTEEKPDELETLHRDAEQNTETTKLIQEPDEVKNVKKDGEDKSETRKTAAEADKVKTENEDTKDTEEGSKAQKSGEVEGVKQDAKENSETERSEQKPEVKTASKDAEENPETRESEQEPDEAKTVKKDIEENKQTTQTAQIPDDVNIVKRDDEESWQKNQRKSNKNKDTEPNMDTTNSA